jgi:hypothetical protein
MSGKYPVGFDCERCGTHTAMKRDGTRRPHTCKLTWQGEVAPWPIVIDKWLANRSGVSVQILHGLMNQGALRGVRLVREGDVGKPNASGFTYFNREDAERIVEKLNPGQ